VESIRNVQRIPRFPVSAIAETTRGGWIVNPERFAAVQSRCWRAADERNLA
jgi:hypothetical protein